MPVKSKKVTFDDEMHTVDLEVNGGHRSLIDSSSAALGEPTELEYLRNILYEYMMGNQTQVRLLCLFHCRHHFSPSLSSSVPPFQTLAKVIASVMKFSKEQTKQVMVKEEQKVRYCSRTSCRGGTRQRSAIPNAISLLSPGDTCCITGSRQLVAGQQLMIYPVCF